MIKQSNKVIRFKYRGFSLIELIVFILIVGIIASGLMVSMQTVLRGSNTPAELLKANRLASARMVAILQQRDMLGVDAFSDPCLGGSPPAACTAAINFATNNNLTVTSQISTVDAQHKLITVTVNGAAYAELQARVANYENP